MEQSIKSLKDGLHWGFVEKHELASDQYKPKLLINNKKNNQHVLETVLEELDHCDSFIFSVAFITESGLATLKSHLWDLKIRGVKGKILTSTYLYFNHPKLFFELLKLENVEVKVINLAGFHAKGYLFQRKNETTIIMGSSNLTAQALKSNYEWNVRLTSFNDGGILDQFQSEINRIWESADLLTLEWVSSYEIEYTKNAQNKNVIKAITTEPLELVGSIIEPNQMQQTALENLTELRKTGATRGLIISATGTGKTYLSAFDVKNFAPKRMLFIVHREQILKKAMQDYLRVLGGNEDDYGILSGNLKDNNSRYLFATIQTISKLETLRGFTADTFDYILIDEVHKAGADTYLRVINYFKPKFLLGMTATPERSDDFNIYGLFDYNIAYEIRLQEALEEDMLCPFHYFGVTDFEKDGQLIDETADLSRLIDEERVNYLIEKIEYYGYSGECVKGLIFCRSKEETRQLSLLLNQKGYRTSFLTGDHSQVERSRCIESLEAGEIDYILTVDIFNEGIDIPSINQVIMLRQTQSSIIFIQQLGRGLRKHSSKEYVTIIDFIGNYKNNYLIPIALSGDKSLNKDNIRRRMKDTSYINGVSTINFEEIAKQKIFSSISESNLTSLKIIRENYIELKYRLNRVPKLQDFIENHTIDPQIFSDQFSSYYNFLLRIKEDVPYLSEWEQKIIVMLSNEILNGKRKHEILLLDSILKKQNISLEEYMDCLLEEHCSVELDTIGSVERVLNLSFFTEGTRNKYGNKALVELTNNIFSLSYELEKSIRKNQYFKQSIEDIILTASLKNRIYQSNRALTLYEKYSRKDACKLLNWLSDESSTIYGYKTKYRTCPIFVTYHKEDDVDPSVKYMEQFLNEEVLRWSTRSNRTLKSEEVKAILNAKENGVDIHVFVKKNDADGIGFYYLGEATPIIGSEREEQMLDSNGKSIPVVHMDLALEKAVEMKLYNYLTNS